MYTVYGIKNCDTVKKALKHLDKIGVEYTFVDFKKTNPTKELLNRWKDFMGDWPVNTKGPTYRKIKENFEAASASNKYSILIESSSAIKRPLVEKNGRPQIAGYDEDKYNKLKK